VTGVLQPDRLGAFVPLDVSPVGAAPSEMAAVAYQPAQPWPHSQTAGEKNALSYIAAILDLPAPSPTSSCYVPPQPDVRSEYCNEEFRGEWSGYVERIRNAKCGSKCRKEHGFSSADLENVKAELAGRGNPGEFVEVQAVQSTWELVRALQTPFGAAGVNADVDLKRLTVEIEEALKPPPASRATGIWLDIFGALLTSVSYYDSTTRPSARSFAPAAPLSGSPPVTFTGPTARRRWKPSRSRPRSSGSSCRKPWPPRPARSRPWANSSSATTESSGRSPKTPPSPASASGRSKAPGKAWSWGPGGGSIRPPSEPSTKPSP
jgi:hypothetical protein